MAKTHSLKYFKSYLLYTHVVMSFYIIYWSISLISIAGVALSLGKI
jgi:hypothetical protein